MRHYELLASGRLPFSDVENAPGRGNKQFGASSPECQVAFSIESNADLLNPLFSQPPDAPQGSRLWLSTLTRAYYTTAGQALEYTRSPFATRAVASYVLEAMGVADACRVLTQS
jgi:hypothetical protein